MAATDAVHTYYRALDTGDYGALQELLPRDFVQHRPDRSFEGREAFVTFMREARPVHETTHEVATVFETADSGAETVEIAVRGCVVDDDGDVLVNFVDVFAVEDGRIHELRTYTR